MKLNPMLRAVTGIWSNYFINYSNDAVKFRINNKTVRVWTEQRTYAFLIEDYDFYIRALGTDVVKYCQSIQKMLEG